MADRSPSVLSRLRNPEYTGENRCLPCTIVNVGIALGASLAIAIGSKSNARTRAGVAFCGALLAIYLRGYLVPGTPALTKRYLPDRVLALFDKHETHPAAETRVRSQTRSGTGAGGVSVPDRNSGSDSDSDSGSGSGSESETEADAERNAESDADTDADGDAEWETIDELERQREHAVDPEQFLFDVGAVEPCDDADDLCLTDAFAERVAREAERYGAEADAVDGDGGIDVDPAEIADLFAVDPAAVAVEDREYPAVKVGRRIHKWPADAALVADLAIHRALIEQTDRWTDVPRGQRLELLEALRSFLDRCPLCGGAIELEDETVESCCRSYEVLALGCVDCAEPLLEFDPREVGGRSGDGGVQP